MRVLHISTWDVPCGIADYCRHLVRGLEQAGVTSEVHPLEPFLWSSLRAEDGLRSFRAMGRRAAGFDLVHVQHEHGLFGARLDPRHATRQFARLLRELRSAGKPVVATFHSELSAVCGPVDSSRFSAGRGRRRWRAAPYFGVGDGRYRAIVHSRETRRSAARGGLPRGAIHVLPHPCPPPRDLSALRASARAALGLSLDTCLMTIFGFVGRYKGHDLALHALEELPSRYRLAIVGGPHPELPDPYLDELLLRVGEDVRSRVTVTGYVDEATADRYFAATDLGLAPYRSFARLSASGAITWALRSGCPTIASGIPAFREVRRAGGCLCLVSPDSAGALARAIRELDRDPALRRRLADRAALYCERNSWEAAARATVGVYERLLRGGTPVLHRPPAGRAGIAPSES